MVPAICDNTFEEIRWQIHDSKKTTAFNHGSNHGSSKQAVTMAPHILRLKATQADFENIIASAPEDASADSSLHGDDEKGAHNKRRC